MSRRALSLPALLLLLPACKGGPGGAGKDGDDTDTPGPACITALLSIPYVAEGADSIGVPIAEGGLDEGARFFSRPIGIAGTGGGSLTVTLTGDAQLLAQDGTELATPVTLTASDLPTTLLLGTTDEDDGTLTATPAEGCEAVSVNWHSVPQQDFAVRAVEAEPWVMLLDTWRDKDAVDITLDPEVHADRVGLDYDIYIVPHRSISKWLDDPELDDVTGDVESVTVEEGTVKKNVVRAWEEAGLEEGDVYFSAYDVVLDFGQDGNLDPGDLIEGLGERPALWVTPDMSEPGPYLVHSDRINDGVWLKEEVFWPADVDTIPGLLPLVIMSHGNGHDYTWYDHLGMHLASWGFVFMSHSNNTGPGIQTASTSLLDNTDHFIANHGTWFDGVLNDRVDLHNIAWLGHSRGGEGVVRAYDRIIDGYVPDEFTADDIRIISSIAPTDFQGVAESNPHDKDYHLLAGAADGDVTGGADCDICQFLRIPYYGTGEISITYMHGASHNNFHNGGGWDDTTGPDGLSREQIHPVQKAVYLSLLGWKQMEIPAYEDWMKVNYETYRPRGATRTAIVATVFRDDLRGSDTLVVDAFQTESSADVNDLGGAVAYTVANVEEGLSDDNNGSFNFSGGDPHNGMTIVSGDGFERGVVFDWDGDADYGTRLPEGFRDVADFDFLSFRATQGTRHALTVAHDGPLAFAVELTDGSDVAVTVPFEALALLTPIYGRTGLGGGAGWANEYNTVRLPLRLFTMNGSGLDLSDIRSIRFLFGADQGAASGRIGLDDIYFGRI